MRKQLSAEWQNRIEAEAQSITVRFKDNDDYQLGYKQGVEDGYYKGAAKYALELVEAQWRIKTLEDKLRMIKQQCAVHKGDNNMIAEIFETADEALSPNNKQK